METKIEEKDSSLFDTLRTPLGLGVALLFSAGVGLGLAFLLKRAKKAKTEYSQLIESIRAKVKERKRQKKQPLVSDQIIEMVYFCTSKALKDKYENIVREERNLPEESRKDFNKFLSSLKSYATRLKVLVDSTIKQVIKEAKIPQTEFLAYQNLRLEESQHLQQSYHQILEPGKEVVERIPHKRKVTVELMKEVSRYEKKALEEALVKYDVKDRMSALLLPGWITSKVYCEFGVNTTRKDYIMEVVELSKRDSEYRELFEKTQGLLGEFLKKYQ